MMVQVISAFLTCVKKIYYFSFDVNLLLVFMCLKCDLLSWTRFIFYKNMIPMNKRKGFFIKDILDPSFGGNCSKKFDQKDNAQCENVTLFRSVKNLREQKHARQLNNINPVLQNNNNNNNESNDLDLVKNVPWPSWIYCTRYSDRPSAGPRNKKERKKEKKVNEKRPRTAFTVDQLNRLQVEFEENKYLTDSKRRSLSSELDLNESQIKIWFQNKRAKFKKLHTSK